MLLIDISTSTIELKFNQSSHHWKFSLRSFVFSHSPTFWFFIYGFHFFSLSFRYFWLIFRCVFVFILFLFFFFHVSISVDSFVSFFTWRPNGIAFNICSVFSSLFFYLFLCVFIFSTFISSYFYFSCFFVGLNERRAHSSVAMVIWFLSLISHWVNCVEIVIG